MLRDESIARTVIAYAVYFCGNLGDVESKVKFASVSPLSDLWLPKIVFRLQ